MDKIFCVRYSEGVLALLLFVNLTGLYFKTLNEIRNYS